MLESKIDDLYRKPLNEFISARSALASEHKGDDGRRIKALKKPTLVPWAVNQVYWHARPIFDRVQASGADLRRAQIAALEGRKADVQAAAAAHRKAIGSAVERAMTLAKAAQMNPDRDAVARTFEALSIASEPPEPPGRLTQPLQPGGFELLAGVEPMARASEGRTPTKGVPDTPLSRGTPIKGVPSTHRAGDGPRDRPGKILEAGDRRPRRGGTRGRRPRARTCPGRCRPPARCGDRQAGARGRAREAAGGTRRGSPGTGRPTSSAPPSDASSEARRPRPVV